MVTEATIKEFLNQKTLAIVGVSRTPQKFSYSLFKALKTKGYHVFAVNPQAEKIAGESCYASIASLPQKVDAVLIVVPPHQTEQVVNDAIAAGIKRIWIQQGAESQAALNLCQKKGIEVIHNHCILMFAEPVGFPHKVHRCIWKVVGKYPK